MITCNDIEPFQYGGFALVYMCVQCIEPFEHGGVYSVVSDLGMEMVPQGLQFLRVYIRMLAS